MQQSEHLVRLQLRRILALKCKDLSGWLSNQPHGEYDDQTLSDLTKVSSMSLVSPGANQLFGYTERTYPGFTTKYIQALLSIEIYSWEPKTLKYIVRVLEPDTRISELFRPLNHSHKGKTLQSGYFERV